MTNKIYKATFLTFFQNSTIEIPKNIQSNQIQKQIKLCNNTDRGPFSHTPYFFFIKMNPNMFVEIKRYMERQIEFVEERKKEKKKLGTALPLVHCLNQSAGLNIGVDCTGGCL